MYQCPFCIERPWTTENAKDMRKHANNIHTSGVKSGTCPYKDCSFNFGDIYKYVAHVEKKHNGKKETETNSEKRKSTEYLKGYQPNKILCLDSASSSDAIPIVHDNIPQKNAIHQINVTSEIINLNHSKKSAFDEKLLEFENKLSEKSAGVVKNLYANISLSELMVQQIIDVISDFQKDAINELRKIDSQFFADNNRVNIGLKLLENAFSHVNTKSKALKPLEIEESFIKPVTKVVDIKLKSSLNKKSRKKSWIQIKTCIQIVPMKLVLRKFFELPNVLETIVKSFETSSFIQGTAWQEIKRQHPDKLVIPLSFFFDDFEANNPLGAHKQKIGAVYYTITCLPPEFYSKLENWFLAQLHKEADYKKLGNKQIFANFREQLLELQESGIEIKINGIQQKIFFRVGRILGDNLGFNQILGFVTGFNADYCCRICLANKEQRQEKYEEDESLLRNEINYTEDVNNAKLTGKPSRGVVERCVFEKVVNIFQIPPIDIFHDLERGMCQHELPRMLHELLSEPGLKFTLDDLNKNIQLLNIDLASGINIPSEITENSINSLNLKLSGSEISFIMEYLGILIGKYIPRGNKIWQLYLLLRKMYYLIKAPICTEESPRKLRDVIKKHHQAYDELKLGNKIVKHHIVNHYPSIVESSGSLCNTSGIRGEAVHRGRKISANVAMSRKNPLYTLAKRYQLTLAKRFSEKTPMTRSTTVKIKKKTTLQSLEDFEKFEKTSPVAKDEEIQILSYVNYDGTLYKLGVSVVVDTNGSLPEFADIKNIIEINGIIYFIVKKLCTRYLNEHVQAYVVEDTDIWLIIQRKDLATHMTFYSQLIELPVDDNGGDEIEINKNKRELEEKKVIVQTYI